MHFPPIGTDDTAGDLTGPFLRTAKAWIWPDPARWNAKGVEAFPSSLRQADQLPPEMMRNPVPS
jgi:hypothetical protein